MQDSIASLISLALTEDIGSGDVTSLYFIPLERRARAFVTARRDGVISGVEAQEAAREWFKEAYHEATGDRVTTGPYTVREAIQAYVEDRKKTYLDFQRFLLEDSPAAFLYYPTTYTIARK